MDRTTRLIRVAEYLVERQGRWVPGYEIATPEVGGSEGLKRVRELRHDHDFPIEKRKMKNSTAYEYRIP
jgi:hypothetical protein